MCSFLRRLQGYQANVQVSWVMKLMVDGLHTCEVCVLSLGAVIALQLLWTWLVCAWPSIATVGLELTYSKSWQQ
jgi:hypothetical protein